MNLDYTKLATVLVGLTLVAPSIATEPVKSNKATSKAEYSQITGAQKTASDWGISDLEYARYQQLIKGIRGSISPSTISPIEVLGIHARNNAERTKYARIWADALAQDTKRVLAFQLAVNQAWEDKGSPELINVDMLSLNDNNNEKAQNNVQYILITKLSPCEACDKKLQGLLTLLSISSGAKLNIYFSDSSSANKGIIRSWAQKNNLDVSMLRTKRITLNHGENLLQQYDLQPSSVPALFEQTIEGGVKRVD